MFVAGNDHKRRLDRGNNSFAHGNLKIFQTFLCDYSYNFKIAETAQSYFGHETTLTHGMDNTGEYIARAGFQFRLLAQIMTGNRLDVRLIIIQEFAGAFQGWVAPESFGRQEAAFLLQSVPQPGPAG